MMSTVDRLPEWMLRVGDKVEISEGPYEGFTGRISEIRVWDRFFTSQIVVRHHGGDRRAALPDTVVRR